VRGALALYGFGKTASARQLIKLLNSREVFENALVEIVNGHFEMKNWTLPE
jgi:hypothetical protein